MTSLRLEDGVNQCSIYFDGESERSYTASLTHSHWVNYTQFQGNLSENFAEYTEGNKVDAFLGGKAYYAALLQAFKQATKSIYITGWQVNWDAQLCEGVRLVDALLEAAKRSPQLKIYIMPWKNPSQVQTWAAATERVFAAMNSHKEIQRDAFHVQLAGSKSGMFFSHHQKCVIVDETLAFVGGIDLAYGRYDDQYGLTADADGRQGMNMYNPGVPFLAPGEGYNPLEEQIYIGPNQESSASGDRYSVESAVNTVRETVLKNQRGQSPGRSWETAYIDPSLQPRMPWQDYQMRIEGPAVDDLIRNFVLRWNSYSHPLPESALKTKIPELIMPTTASLKKGSCQVQVLRSASLVMRQDEYRKMPQLVPKPKLKQDDILRSIHQLIFKAEHFIYIENQFFVSAFGESSISDDDDELSPIASSIDSAVDDFFTRILPDEDAPQNPVAEWLGDKLKWIILSHKPQPFHIYIVLPVHPEGKLNDPTIVAQIHLTRQSLVFGSHSLLNRIRRSLWVKQQLESQGGPRKEWHKRIQDLEARCGTEYKKIDFAECDSYVTLLNLRDYAMVGGGIAVTEQIYVHSKLMIVDDRYVLVGSANINDRSLQGDRDSELAVLISDTAHEYTDLDGTGKKVPFRNFARNLRQDAWRKWMGSAAYECLDALDKPAIGWAKVQEIAKDNADAYEDVFSFIPRDIVSPLLAPSAPYASLWPVLAVNSLPDIFARRMPFTDSFWRYSQCINASSLEVKVKGYFTTLSIHWTEGENNLIPFNMRLIASNPTPDNEDIQIADNESDNDDGNATEGSLS